MRTALRLCVIVAFSTLAIHHYPAMADDSQPKKLVIIAGKPSHPPRMHEFNAGVQLLNKCLKDFRGLQTEIVLNGWPADEGVFQDADAVVFYMDGGAKHEAVQEDGRRLKLISQWASEGVGIGCMHYGVEVVPDQAGKEFLAWIGGHYEHMFSCNPIWEPTFSQFPDHPVTRGVKPFSISDEWYFNMRFINDIAGNDSVQTSEQKFVPILVAVPSAAVRSGPYVYPKGPYPHIEANANRAETMMWTVERADGGRGFGFTGGHFHDNWSNDNFRKIILNAMVWLAKGEVPENGVASHLDEGDIDANLDPKPRR
ncbi:MAG: ThuA domain-containing protein [Planctomycetales bacterium]|nr:ThuA domain-containing protein [Planctomycetales bacterium]